MDKTVTQAPDVSTLQALLELSLEEVLGLVRHTYEGYCQQDASNRAKHVHFLTSTAAKHVYGALVAVDDLIAMNAPQAQPEPEEKE